MKTPEEIEDLKSQWLADGCWDIESTSGFEAHHRELLEWRQNYEAERDRQLEERDRQAARAAGLSLEDYRQMGTLQRLSESNRGEAENLLVHYLGNGLDWDCQNEIRAIAHFIVEAAVAACKAELIRETASTK
jgi:hypothetical protein